MQKELFTTQECQAWIKKFGKEKIQAFQDSLADLFNISLCLLALDGKALTVWSNSSLFCHYMLTKNRERCLQERQNTIKYVTSKLDYHCTTCYMGLTFFCSPIFFKDKVIAVFYGGAIYLEDNKKIVSDKLSVDIPVFTERKLKDVLHLIKNLSFLLNIHDELPSISYSQNSNSNEYFYLQKKLTQREIEIVKLINIGLTNKEISNKLHISEKTVKTHVSNILKKLEMKDRTQIILFCKQNNML